MNRRSFFAVPLALVAVAKGWFEGKAIVPHVDVVDLDDWEIPSTPCECCNSPAGFMGYPRRISNPKHGDRFSIYLCDTCAEKQGHLCERRNDFGLHGILYPCDCGKRGCPGLEGLRDSYRQAMKPGPLTEFLRRETK